MNTSLRLARANAYPAIASLLNAREDGDHQVEAGEFQRCAERWVRHDRAFRRVVGVTDGVIVTTGCVCADWGGRTEPGQSWVNIAVPPGTARASRAIGFDIEPPWVTHTKVPLVRVLDAAVGEVARAVGPARWRRGDQTPSEYGSR